MTFELRRNTRESDETDRLNNRLFSDALLSLVDDISQHSYSFIPKRRLLSLANCVKRVEKRAVPGIFIEAGCARGGSAGLIARVMGQQRILELFDVFEKLPPPMEVDGVKARVLYDSLSADSPGALGRYMEHVGAEDPAALTLDIVTRLSGKSPTSFRLHRGLVQHTLIGHEPVAFIHIDLDWYEPTLRVLHQAVPRMALGATAVIDDIYYWPGCGRAVEQYFADKKDEFHYDSSNGHLIVERVREPE